MKKILFVAPTLNYGGAERVMSILSNNWVDNNNVTIVLTQSRAESAYVLDEKVELVSILEHLPKARHPHRAIIKELRKTICEISPDCVICFYNDVCALTALALLGLKIPLIYSERNDPNKTNQDLTSRLYRIIVEHRCSGFVFQTEGAKQCYSKRVQSASDVIMNPLSFDSIPSHKYDYSKKTIVSVGRLTSQKRQDVLIDAFNQIAKRYPDWKLVIYGEGEQRTVLQQLITEKGLNHRILMPGTVSNVLDRVSECDIFVLSSDYEGLPNALIEAMCIGMPCISTDCSPGGARMLINDGFNGFIVECNSPVKLAEKMKDLIDHPQVAQVIGENALVTKERVNPSAICRKWLNYLDRLTRA